MTYANLPNYQSDNTTFDYENFTPKYQNDCYYLKLDEACSERTALISNKNGRNKLDSVVKISLSLNNEKPDRRKSQLLKLVAIYFGIELLFSIEVALTLPILLKLRVSENAYSFVYFLSPILGFFAQPILGVMSDNCTSRFGRRRPFILALSTCSYLGICLILNGKLIGDYFGDLTSNVRFMILYIFRV
jgi:hypothetical protein